MQPTISRGKGKHRVQRRKKKAEELFEPEELQRGYLTQLDINIRRIDKPERFQVRFIKAKKRNTRREKIILFS